VEETSADKGLPGDGAPLVAAEPPLADRWLWPALIILAAVGGCAFLVLTYQIVAAEAGQRDWKSARNSIETQLAGLHREVDSANVDIATLSGRRQDIGQQIAALDQERSRRESEAQRLKADLDTLNGRRTSLAEQVAAREKHEQELTRRVAPLEKRVHDLEQRRDRAISDLATAKAQLGELRSRHSTRGKRKTSQSE